MIMNEKITGGPHEITLQDLYENHHKLDQQFE